ncbi:MAG: type II toxin-antitoxin system PemK/MazF family toxin [Microscillaceae bacterium]|nr:type II toxin-antitoxin system PemK/MazF family toxin [Microscillaceae bacterium]
MNVGDIAKARLQQADGSYKLRPVLLLKQMPPFQDWLVCGISTQLRQFVVDFDILMDNTHPDFALSGLIAPSIIRLGFMAVLPDSIIQGTIGRISAETYQTLLQNLINHLQS